MRVDVGRGVRDMVRLVADRVVGMVEVVGADGRRDDFATVVVGEARLNGLAARSTIRSRSRAGERVVCGGVRIDGFIVERRRAAIHEALSVEASHLS